mmetsp:Transcript_5647/g.10115  ORF Transcript_5647/g.10115 Transcript_5647/m.10115 type:complete len:205 (+) Transcript_5647:96-710(+)
MAVSLRFLSQASKNIVAHAPTPKTPMTPKTPKTPKTPQSPFSPVRSPVSPGLSFFPCEEAKKVPKAGPARQRSVHFADTDPSTTWVGNASSLLSTRGLGPLMGGPIPGGYPQAQALPEEPLAAAAATREAVRARQARQETRCVPTPRVATEKTLPTLLGKRQSPRLQAQPLPMVEEESCAHAARRAFLEQQLRRASRAMVHFVV